VSLSRLLRVRTGPRKGLIPVGAVSGLFWLPSLAEASPCTRTLDQAPARCDTQRRLQQVALCKRLISAR
jgi:hypothetical protein